MRQQDSIQTHLQQKVLKDVGTSLSTSALRTPVMQIDSTKPAHLNVARPVFVKPRITYQKLSHNDSVYLNLVKAKTDNVFDGDLNVKDILLDTQTVTDIAAIDQPVAEGAASPKPAPIRRENIETITIKPESKALKTRGNNQFHGSKEWLSGFILLALIIAGAIRLSASKYLSDIFSSIRYQQSASKLFSTSNLQNQKPGLALSFLFILNSSLLLFEYATVSGGRPESLSPFLFLLLIMGGMFIYFVGKNLTYRFLGFVFDTIVDTRSYLFNADLLNKTFGIALLPFVSAVPFVDLLTATFLLKTALVLFLLMYVLQLLRGVKIILRSPLSIFYMFLYFCALEILPLSILIKTMIL